jgi:predicted metal-dependent phosphotriesterase family hydrolase
MKISALLPILVSAIFFSCSQETTIEKDHIMTINGLIHKTEMGITLEHEHVTVDFTGAEKVPQPQYPLQLAMDSLLPHFRELSVYKVKTLIECTPQYIGRDIKLLKALSRETGLNILTNTGYYAAADKNYLPAHAYTETAEQLAKRWITEWNDGIEGTEIKPGFIKLGVGNKPLDETEQKLVAAGAITHLASGLKIAVHTGSAVAAQDEIDILAKHGVAPEALIIVHAQNASDDEQVHLARQGAWVSLDGVFNSPKSIYQYSRSLIRLKGEDLLHKVLISQDAFWQVMNSEDNTIYFERMGSPYSAIFEVLIPALLDKGFTQDDIDQLLITNPGEAYKIEVLRL